MRSLVSRNPLVIIPAIIPRRRMCRMISSNSGCRSGSPPLMVMIEVPMFARRSRRFFISSTATGGEKSSNSLQYVHARLHRRMGMICTRKGCFVEIRALAMARNSRKRVWKKRSARQNHTLSEACDLPYPSFMKLAGFPQPVIIHDGPDGDRHLGRNCHLTRGLESELNSHGYVTSCKRSRPRLTLGAPPSSILQGSAKTKRLPCEVLMQSLASDLRYAARELRKRPGFTLTAVLSLAVGIGATSAVFSVIYAVLIDPFPYPGSDRIVELRLVDKSGSDRFAGPNGQQADQLRQAKSIEDVTLMDWWNLTTTDGDLPEDVQAMYIDPNAPNHWGIRAMKGRWLIPSDAPPGQSPQPVVVLTYHFWQRYFMGDPAVIGRTIQLVHKPYQIVGVMPPRFKWGNPDMYVPLKVTQDPNIHYAASIKLRPGVNPEQASAELQPLVEEFAKQAPTQYPDKFKVKLRSIVEVYARPLGPTLYLLLGAVASLLLIGCANVSILLLARGTERQHELAVRSAIGASRGRMIRQLLTESLGIATAGALLGVLLAWKGLGLIAANLPEFSFPAESVIKMNVPVLLFSIGLAFVTAIVFGLWPALQLSRPELARLMQSSSRRVAGSVRARRSHGVMVGAQVALTLLMLSAAGAAGKGFVKLVKTDLGYDPHNAMSVPIPIHENTHVEWKDRAEYFEQIRARIAAMPQVVGAGISTNATPPQNGWPNRIEIMSSTAPEKPEVRVNFVDTNYFSLLKIPLARGRLWDHTEIMRGALLMVINQTMARQFWSNGDAVGHQVRIPGFKDQPPYQREVPGGADGWMQITGVVADARDD